jgi:hypothetical protein
MNSYVWAFELRKLCRNWQFHTSFDPHHFFLPFSSSSVRIFLEVNGQQRPSSECYSSIASLPRPVFWIWLAKTCFGDSVHEYTYKKQMLYLKSTKRRILLPYMRTRHMIWESQKFQLIKHVLKINGYLKRKWSFQAETEPHLSNSFIWKYLWHQLEAVECD